METDKLDVKAKCPFCQEIDSYMVSKIEPYRIRVRCTSCAIDFMIGSQETKKIKFTECVRCYGDSYPTTAFFFMKDKKVDICLPCLLECFGVDQERIEGLVDDV